VKDQRIDSNYRRRAPDPSAAANAPGADESGAEDSSDDGPLVLVAPGAVAGVRVDKVLAELLTGYSRSRIQQWLDAGLVLVNGAPSGSRQAVYAGDVLTVWPAPEASETAFRPEPVEFTVLHEDAEIIVVDKRAGLVVHPGSGNWTGTLLNGLLHRYPELAAVPRAGIVHRLDRDTSGVMVVARSITAQTDLVRQLQARTMSRAYTALCRGAVVIDGADEGRIEAPIGRDPRNPTRMAVVSGNGGKPAATRYRIVRTGSLARRPVTELICRLESGRTHQIRVHMRHLGHPLVGDPVYGVNAADVEAAAATGVPLWRQMLHARELVLMHPASGEAVSFTAGIPPDLQAVLASVEWNS
jgi:23S rRNA pseudouridine1911/1915/1917 synthase